MEKYEFYWNIPVHLESNCSLRMGDHTPCMLHPNMGSSYRAVENFWKLVWKIRKPKALHRSNFFISGSGCTWRIVILSSITKAAYWTGWSCSCQNASLVGPGETLLCLKEFVLIRVFDLISMPWKCTCHNFC